MFLSCSQLHSLIMCCCVVLSVNTSRVHKKFKDNRNQHVVGTYYERPLSQYHRFLSNNPLSEDMLSLLGELKRSKRVSHHGRSKVRKNTLNVLSPTWVSGHKEIKRKHGVVEIGRNSKVSFRHKIKSKIQPGSKRKHHKFIRVARNIDRKFHSKFVTDTTTTPSFKLPSVDYMYTPIVKDLHHTLCFGTNCIKNVKFKRKNIDDFERDLSSNISDILNEMFRNKKELLTQKNHKRDDIDDWYTSYTTSPFPILSSLQSEKLSWSSIKRLLRDDAGNCTNKLPTNVSRILKKIVSDVEELREVYSPSNEEEGNTKVLPLEEQYTTDENVKAKIQENMSTECQPPTTSQCNFALDITTIPVQVNNDLYSKISIGPAVPAVEKPAALGINYVPNVSSLLVPTTNTPATIATDMMITNATCTTMSTNTKNTNCNVPAEELLKGLSKIVNCLKGLTNNMADEEKQMNNIPNTSPMTNCTTLSIPKANIKRSLFGGQNTPASLTTENKLTNVEQSTYGTPSGEKIVPTLSTHSTGIGFDEANCLDLNMSCLNVPNDGSSLSEMAKSMNTMVANIQAIVSSRGLRNKREDFPCDINGSWISVAGGVRLDINIINGKALEIKMEELSPEGKTPGFLKKGNWSLTGSLPLPQTSFIMLTGSNAQEKQVATFIGECKVCKKRETVAGHWLHVKHAKDCDSEKFSHQLLSDVWIREALHTLRKKKLDMLKGQEGMTNTSSSTTTTKT